MQNAFEDERRKSSESVESITMVERRVATVQLECSELRTALEQSERARKGAENELADTTDRVNELSSQLQSSLSQKRRLEADISAMRGDLEEITSEMRRADEQAKKATLDANRLADELRNEKDRCSQVEKMRRVMETQINEMTIRISETESKAMKGGKNAVAQLASRVSTHS